MWGREFRHFDDYPGVNGTPTGWPTIINSLANRFARCSNSLSPLQYLAELLELYGRFQKIEIGIDLIQQHHKQHGIQTQPQLLAAESVNLARSNVKAVLKSLDEYYEANGFDVAEVPAVDESVIPEDLREYGNSRRILHHYVILKQFLDHLNFSKDVIERFNQQRQTRAMPGNEEAAQNGQVVATGDN